MNYKKIYESIILRAKTRQHPDCYTEKHHIVPRCMGGDDHESNLVILKPEEHYVCHQLLVKIYPSNIKLLYAIQAMSMDGSLGKRSNKMYKWLKVKYNTARRTGIYKKCKYCEEEFYARANRLSKPYCSKACYHNHKSSSLKCTNCFTEFKRPNSLNTANEKFCSKECKKEFKSYFFNCFICNKRVRVPKCRVKQCIPRFCSVKCRGNGH